MFKPTMMPRRRQRPPQDGFLLIEVLVSAVIFAVGVLALVGLQGKMNRAESEAKDRADAAYMASELQGRMWADVAQLASYNNCPANTSNASCTAWVAKLATVLPGSSLAGMAPTVTVATATGVVEITIRWKTALGNAHQYTTQTTIHANPP